MKRLLGVISLIAMLSFPVFAGHTQSGDWCADGTPGCNPDPVTVNKSVQGASYSLNAETLLILAMLATLLRLRN